MCSCVNRISSYHYCFKMHSWVAFVCFVVSIVNAQNTCTSVIVTLENLNFTLFTRQNQMNGVALNEATYNLVNTTDLTILIIHGWLQSATKPWIPLMRDTYLNKTSANIIVVDWSTYSENVDFTKVACAVPQVGNFVGDLLHNLTKVGVDLGKVQINGFSFGAHVAGDAGQRVFGFTNSKVKRINGLDAANQQFAGKPIDQRLDASDAVFVQAIHTNNNGYGFAENYGTIDFVVNYNLLTCGSYQVGCPANPGVPTGGSPLPNLFCDHIRSIAYYIESINSDKFLGVECGSCSAFGFNMCNSNPKTVMGEMCPYDQTGVRYLNTKAMPPFAQG